MNESTWLHQLLSMKLPAKVSFDQDAKIGVVVSDRMAAHMLKTLYDIYGESITVGEVLAALDAAIFWITLFAAFDKSEKDKLNIDSSQIHEIPT